MWFWPFSIGEFIQTGFFKLFNIYCIRKFSNSRKFTQKSDIYALGVRGLRPEIPESAPEAYKRLSEKRCNADPNERPDARQLYSLIVDQIRDADKDKSQNNV